MSLDVVATDDGSSSLFSDRFNTLYHSSRGAVGEARHVFTRFLTPDCRVLEVGLGSGLNALLSMQSGLRIRYTAIELYPVPVDVLPSLSFYCDDLHAIHLAPWGERVALDGQFSLLKLQTDLMDFDAMASEKFDLIFFDAFDPQTQPELWSEAVFKRLHNCLAPDGSLLTYCAKGDVKRALRSSGFTVHRLPGAMGKHHMVRANNE